ncbi:MAG TPA: HPF/RaiA family ribosome-associated protein [Gemmatimonadales bacterium]|nr:HPF/RaiA family ribosome-associated protein [Gemmatimonadales bacterium]
MQTPVQVSARGAELAPEQEQYLQQSVDRLEKFFPRIVACRVAVEVPNRYAVSGEPVTWAVRLGVTVPGGDVTVNREAEPSFRQAVDAVFDAARRQLQDYGRTIRGDVKRRAEQRTGTVTRLLAYEGYGFITTEDGEEIYFHRNAVADEAFDRLTEGSEVRFVEVEGAEGPQASTVVIHRLAPEG